MANFQISITDANGDKDVNGAANVVTIVDYSNYGDDTEDGHAQSDFSDYYKITLSSYNGYSYVAYSKTGQDKQINSPSDEGDLPITNTLVNKEDDVHTVVLIAVPTYDAAVAYVGATHCVYYDGVLYECIQNGTDKTPDTETAYWSVVIDANLPEKYRLSYTWTITYDMLKEFVINVYKANDDTWDVYQKKIFDNKYFQFCSKMMLLFESIDINADEEAWTDIANIITKAKSLIDEL